MIEVNKILNGFSSVNKNIWFEQVDPNGPHTRNLSDPLNLKIKNVRSDIRKNFFSQRVVPFWNRLPNTIKAAPSLDVFKARYDEKFCA